MVIGIARLLLVSYESLRASNYIHTGLTRNILTTGFGFFNKTAFGEIINRFSRDLQNVDQDLAVLALGTLHFLVALLGIITQIAVLTPAFLCREFSLDSRIGLLELSTSVVHATSSKSKQPSLRRSLSTLEKRSLA